jgi:hypothetical protein
LNGKKLDNKKLDNKTLNNKKLKQVNIIFNYGSLTIKCQPLVIIYNITVKGLDLIVKQISNPQIRNIINRTIKTFKSINLKNNQCFLSQLDI